MTEAAAVCRLCGMVGSVETDVSLPRSRAQAAAWAIHFALDHPDVTYHASDYIDLTEAPS